MDKRSLEIINYVRMKERAQSSAVHAHLKATGDDFSLVSVKRALSHLRSAGILKEQGAGPATFYTLSEYGKLIAPVDGKLNGAPLDAQLEEYIKLWLDGLGGQIGPMAKQDILSAGDAPAMLQRAAELAQGKIDGSHRDGLNYVPYDGYVMEAHEGERLQTNKQARDSDRTAEEVRGLSGKFDRMLIAMNTIAVATGTTSSLLRNVTRDGDRKSTTTA